MIDELTIYIDRLHGGVRQHLLAEVSAQQVAVDEMDVKILRPIKVKGQAYLADHHLIVQLDMATRVSKPCRVCNEAVPIDLELKEAYWMLPVEEIAGAKIEGLEIIRELLLSEIPPFVECNSGSCPQRSEMEKFIHRGTEEFRPFKDL